MYERKQKIPGFTGMFRRMAAAGGTTAFSGIPVVKHSRAFQTVSPIVLNIRAGIANVLKREDVSLGIMAAARHTSALSGKPVIKHDVAFVAIPPFGLKPCLVVVGCGLAMEK
jgi:hypothetical protein